MEFLQNNWPFNGPQHNTYEANAKLRSLLKWNLQKTKILDTTIRNYSFKVSA